VGKTEYPPDFCTAKYRKHGASGVTPWQRERKYLATLPQQCEHRFETGGSSGRLSAPSAIEAVKI
jgi:hypothetical protein